MKLVAAILTSTQHRQIAVFSEHGVQTPQFGRGYETLQMLPLP
jgi:hypothetical protein